MTHISPSIAKRIAEDKTSIKPANVPFADQSYHPVPLFAMQRNASPNQRQPASLTA
jgi:hypothetical protein